jgi:hypothetical protein
MCSPEHSALVSFMRRHCRALYTTHSGAQRHCSKHVPEHGWRSQNALALRLLQTLVQGPACQCRCSGCVTCALWRTLFDLWDHPTIPAVGIDGLNGSDVEAWLRHLPKHLDQREASALNQLLRSIGASCSCCNMICAATARHLVRAESEHSTCP